MFISNCLANIDRLAANIPHYMDVQRDDARQSWLSHPRRRAKAEVLALLLIFVPHKYNSRYQKLFTLMVFSAWFTIEIGAAFEYAHIPDQFALIRGIVLILIGRMWGLELNNLAGIEFSNLNNSGSNGNE